MIPMSEDMTLMRRIAAEGPPAVEAAARLVAVQINSGVVKPGDETSFLGLLRDFAEISEQLRGLINDSLDHGLIKYYCNEWTDVYHQREAAALSRSLTIGRPQHYFDLARKVVTVNGALVVVGAGCSCDSNAPCCARWTASHPPR